jgi:hypothetical protein
MTNEVCIANIGPKQRRMRLNFGIVAGLAGVAMAIVLAYLDVQWWMRAVVFLPFYLAGSGFWQWRDKT